MNKLHFDHPEDYLKHRGWSVTEYRPESYEPYNYHPLFLYHYQEEGYSCVNNRYEPALIDQLLRDLDSLGGLEAFVRLIDEERA